MPTEREKALKRLEEQALKDIRKADENLKTLDALNTEAQQSINPDPELDLVQRIAAGRAPNAVQFGAPPRIDNDEALLGMFKGAADLGIGLTGFGANTVQQLGFGLVNSIPFLPEVDPEINLRNLFPKDSKAHQILLESPSGIVEGVKNIVGLTGFTDNFNRRLEGLRTGKIPSRGVELDDDVEEKLRESPLMDTLMGIQETSTTAGNHVKAFTGAVLDLINPAPEIDATLQAFSASDSERFGRGVFNLAAMIVPIERFAIAPLKASIRKGAQTVTGLPPLKRGVTKTDLQTLGLIGKANRKTHNAVALDMQGVADALNIRIKDIPDTQQLIDTLKRSNTEVVAEAVRLHNASPDVGFAEHLARTIEQGRIPSIEVQTRMTAKGITAFEALAEMKREARDLAALTRRGSSEAGTSLNAFSINELTNAFHAAVESGLDPAEKAKQTLADLNKRYAEKGQPNLLGVTRKLIYEPVGVAIRGALAVRVGGPRTLVRDVISQTASGVMDAFEKSLADGILRTTANRKQLPAHIRRAYATRNAPSLTDLDGATAYSADLVGGYLSTLGPKNYSRVTQILSELPVEGKRILGEVNPDIGAQNLGLLQSNFARNAVRQYSQALKNTKTGTKEAIKGGLEALQGKAGGLDRFDAGINFATLQGVAQFTNAHRTFAELTQLKMYFGGHLQAAIKRTNGKIKDFDDFLTQLKNPQRDPALDVMFKEAAAFAEERTFRLEPEFGQGLLQFWRDHPITPILTGVHYPRFFYNRYAFMWKRNPTQMLSMFDKDFLKNISGEAFDLENFTLAAKRRGIEKGTAQFDDALTKALTDSRRKSAETIARGISGTATLFTAYALRQSKLAGAQWYEVDLGSANEPNFAGKYLTESGALEYDKSNPNNRLTMDMRNFDPPFASFLAAAHFIDVWGKTGSKEAAVKSFSASDFSELFLGVRNISNTGLSLGQMLQRTFDPDTQLTQPGELAETILGDEILGSYSVALRLFADPFEAYTDLDKHQQDPFDDKLTGRLLQNARGLFLAAGTDAPLNPRGEPGQNKIPALNQGFGLITGINVSSHSPVERLMQGANLTRRDFIGQTSHPQEAREKLKAMNNILALPFSNKKGKKTSIGDAISFKVQSILAEQVKKGTPPDVRQALSRTIQKEIFKELREVVNDDVKRATIEEKPFLIFDELAEGQNALVQLLLQKRAQEFSPEDLTRILEEAAQNP